MEDGMTQSTGRSRKGFLKLSLIVVIGLCAAVLLAKLITSEKESCNRSCAADGKPGSLAYVYSKEQTAGMRGRGPTECRCEP